MARIDPDALHAKVSELKPAVEEAIQGFRPQFGNQDHITLVEALTRLSKMEIDMAAKLKYARGGEKLASDIVRTQQNIIQSLTRLKCQTLDTTVPPSKSEDTLVSG